MLRSLVLPLPLPPRPACRLWDEASALQLRPSLQQVKWLGLVPPSKPAHRHSKQKRMNKTLQTLQTLLALLLVKGLLQQQEQQEQEQQEEQEEQQRAQQAYAASLTWASRCAWGCSCGS